MKRLLLSFILVLVAGCAAQKPQIPPDQWAKLANKTYADTSKIDVIKAVEKLFNLADYRDFQIAYTANGIKGIRWESRFPNNYLYHWDVAITEKGGSVIVSVDISTSGYPNIPLPSGTPEVVQVFFSRLDYLLGKSAKWTTCAEYKSQFGAKPIETLCSNADDNTP